MNNLLHMKKFYVLLLLFTVFFFAGCNKLTTQSHTSRVAEDEKETQNDVISATKKSQENMTSKEVFTFDESGQPVDIYQEEFEDIKIYRLGITNATGYYEDGKLVRISVLSSGDREDLLSEYLIGNDQLRNVTKTYLYFDPPKWEDNPKVIQEKKHGFRFDSGKMIEWIDANGQSVDRNSNKFQQKEEQILNDFRNYLSLLIS